MLHEDKYVVSLPYAVKYGEPSSSETSTSGRAQKKIKYEIYR